MKQAKATVINKAGLHARAASKLAALSARFAADIRIAVVHKDEQQGQLKQVDAKSILSLMMLAAVAGSELHIEADGSDEEEALAALLGLIGGRFDEAE